MTVASRRVGGAQDSDRFRFVLVQGARSLAGRGSPIFVMTNRKLEVLESVVWRAEGLPYDDVEKCFDGRSRLSEAAACVAQRIEKDVLESMECTKEKFGGVNVLVNSAGVVGYEEIYDFQKKKPHSVELYKCIFETNVWGTFNVTRLMAGMMAENKPDSNKQRGVIVNLASAMAFESSPGLIAYGASNSAIVGLTLPLARGLAQKGIRVVAINPGYIDSPMTAPLETAEKKVFVSTNLTPKRFGTCEEVAHIIQACIENPLINGETIRIDMGWRYCQVKDNPEEAIVNGKC
ncbi:hypothetical protein KM043_014493 [Ampulex compressa]|nr:hypothetical protein KM043_014493 [Ampulex compressa]